MRTDTYSILPTLYAGVSVTGEITYKEVRYKNVEQQQEQCVQKPIRIVVLNRRSNRFITPNLQIASDMYYIRTYVCTSLDKM